MCTLRYVRHRVITVTFASEHTVNTETAVLKYPRPPAMQTQDELLCSTPGFFLHTVPRIIVATAVSLKVEVNLIRRCNGQ
jgi:hypothetical protein